jgi:hypothetical protein
MLKIFPVLPAQRFVGCKIGDGEEGGVPGVITPVEVAEEVPQLFDAVTDIVPETEPMVT